MVPAGQIEKVAVIGAGTIGASWAALFAANIATVGVAFNLLCLVTFPPETWAIVLLAKSVNRLS